MVETVVSFAAVATVFNVSPGPDVLLVVRHASRRGHGHGVAVALGAACGSLVWGLAAAFGLAAVFAQSGAAATTLRVVGGLYLVALGLGSLGWRRDLHPAGVKEHPPVPGERMQTPGAPRQASFLVGLGADLLNPKVGAFYLAIIPPFVAGAGEHVLAACLVLTVVEICIAVVCLCGYATIAARSSGLLIRPRVRVGMDRLAGVLLVGLGLHLALLG